MPPCDIEHLPSPTQAIVLHFLSLLNSCNFTRLSHVQLDEIQCLLLTEALNSYCCAKFPNRVNEMFTIAQQWRDVNNTANVHLTQSAKLNAIFVTFFLFSRAL